MRRRSESKRVIRAQLIVVIRLLGLSRRIRRFFASLDSAFAARARLHPRGSRACGSLGALGRPSTAHLVSTIVDGPQWVEV